MVREVVALLWAALRRLCSATFCPFAPEIGNNYIVGRTAELPAPSDCADHRVWEVNSQQHHSNEMSYGTFSTEGSYSPG